MVPPDNAAMFCIDKAVNFRDHTNSSKWGRMHFLASHLKFPDLLEMYPAPFRWDRVVCVDSMSFDHAGNIRVTPTPLRTLK
jgi:hypothetical protein